ncbi:TIGR01777 family oxidoreductase [Parachryseolinea silvisoli]|uniref:TIGR01777 family oxidoreductase n=1 Tax=Parachryseolinea silvisoli TaxID=2873601 RepID=UPI002265822F|nr:TIGR01777 family oxidoreductase [Parachryseolinea silvisoli]
MTAKNILITGASGLIGTHLTELLQREGRHVAHLSRSNRGNKTTTFLWHIAQAKLDVAALQGTDTIVHLAGAGVGEKRWTDSYKKEILESRTHSTRLLYDTLRQHPHTVKTFVSASAIGYYGFEDNDSLLTEEHPSGKDFMAQVTRAWEEEVDRIATLGIRVVKIRIGIVLAAEGGALEQMAKPVKLFVGAPLGTGRQNVSWIHIHDICRMFIKAMDDEAMQGPYNGTGPYAITNCELTKAIGKAIGRPVFMPPVPGVVLKMLIGQMAEVVLTGSNVSSKKIQGEGFQFQFKTLEGALKDLLH